MWLCLYRPIVHLFSVLSVPVSSCSETEKDLEV